MSDAFDVSNEATTPERRLRVLVVDDVLDIRFLIRTRLEETAGILVVGEAADPGEALRLANDLRPDAVITDLFTSVAEAAYVSRLRAALPDSCIVLCSAAGPRAPAVVNGLVAGADAYFDKGEAFSGIGNRLLDVCRSRRRPS